MSGFVNPIKANTQGTVYVPSTGIVTTIDGSTADFVYTSNGPGVAPAFKDINTLPYYSLTPYIVGPDVHSEFTTIQAALNAAAVGADSTFPANIYVKTKNGAYIENLVLKDYCNIIGMASNSADLPPPVLISGTMTAPGGVTCSLNNLSFENGASNIANITTQSMINFRGCTFTQNFAGPMVIFHPGTQSASVTFQDCFFGTASNNAFDVNLGTIRIINCDNSLDLTATTSTAVDCILEIRNSRLQFPISTSGTTAFTANANQFLNGLITHDGTSNPVGTLESFVTNCIFINGSASCLSIGSSLPVTNSTFKSSNTNVITGGGELKYALLAFSGSSSGVNTSTLTPLATLL